MRVKQNCKICDLYEDRAKQVYTGSRCRVVKYKGSLLCIFSEHTTKLSKRQREWLYHVLGKMAEFEFKGDYKISTMEKGDHYFITAQKKDAKKTKSKKSKKQSG